MADHYNVLAFDPGGTTGWAVLCLYDGVIGPPPFDTWMREWERNRGGTSAPEADPLKVVEEARLAYKAEQAEAANYKILDNVAYWKCGQFVGDIGDQVDEMIELTEAWPPDTPVIHEAFILRTFRMDPILLQPVRVTDRYRHAVRDLGPKGFMWRSLKGAERKQYRRDVIQQPAAIAKAMVTDDRLKRMEVPFFAATRGLPHARDAVRHALTFLRREKEARFNGRTLHVC